MKAIEQRQITRQGCVTPALGSCFQAKLFQRVRFEFFERDEFERRSMGRFEVHRRGAVMFERGFPARDANAPFVARFQSGESPFRNGRDQIVAVEHGEIEKVASHFYANGVQADVFGSGSTKTVAIKSSDGIAATAFQFCSEDVRRHD